jgi:hypothetical protein
VRWKDIAYPRINFIEPGMAFGLIALRVGLKYLIASLLFKNEEMKVRPE